MASTTSDRPPAAPLTLAELIDLECRLSADRYLDRQTLRERDWEIGAAIRRETETEPDRHEILRRWLGAVSVEASGPGARVQAVYSLAGYVLSGLGLLAGASAAAAVLRYDGTHPVNIIHFLAVFVGFQLLLGGLALVHMLPRGRLTSLPGLGPLHEALRHLGYRRGGLDGWVDRLHGVVDSDGVGAALAHLRSWSTLYADVERWSLLALTQRVGVFFNVGALAVCTYLIAVTDLAFAWSTTLPIETATMTRLLQTLAWPWWWLADAVPSAELVEASRYFRQEGSYDPARLAGWWSFLVAALVTYGLVPRVTLWLVARRRLWQARCDLPLDHGDCEAVVERLFGARVGWVVDDAATGDEPGPTETAAVPGAVELPAPDAQCLVLGWADVPLDRVAADALVQRRFGWRAAAVHAAGGTDDGDGAPLAHDLQHAEPDTPVVIVAEAFEAPSKAFRRFLTELRESVGAHRPIVVGLVSGAAPEWQAPDDDDRELWLRAVGRLADPYIRVEEMVTS